MVAGQYIVTSAASDLTWTQAKALAETMGGQLASLTSADENDAIKQALALGNFYRYVSSHSGQGFGPWIGLTQAAGSPEPGGGWTWLDGSAFSYNGWHPTQPDNYAGDNVASFFLYNGAVGWADTIDDPTTIGLDFPRSKSAVVEFSAAQTTLTGSDNADYIIGSAVNNIINGGGGNDYLEGRDGNDTLNGGDGFDSAVFAGTYESHVITRLGNGSWTVSSGSETDTLTGVEALLFDVKVTASGNSSATNPNFTTLAMYAPDVNAAIADQSVAEETAWIFTVSANTFKGMTPAKFVYSASLADGTALPSWLSFDAATHIFSGVPPKDFNGNIDLKVTAREDNLGAFDTFRLTVTPTNDAPVVSGTAVLSPAVIEDGTRLIAVSELVASASDVDGNTLSVTGLSASSGKLINNGNGTYVFAPAADDDTSVTFTYVVTDGHGGTAGGNATLDITPINDAPRFFGGTRAHGGRHRPRNLGFRAFGRRHGCRWR